MHSAFVPLSLCAFARDRIRAMPWGDLGEDLPNSRPVVGEHRCCVACGKDDCSVGHWVRWCPIPVIVANILLQVRSTSLCGIAGLGPRTVTASRCFTYSPPVSSAPA